MDAPRNSLTAAFVAGSSSFCAVPHGPATLSSAACTSRALPAASTAAIMAARRRAVVIAVANGGAPDGAATTSAAAATASAKVTRSQYDQLAELTTIVEDTGEINYIADHRPYAATTNPTLVAAAADRPEYQDVVHGAIEYGKKTTPASASFEDRLAITRNCLFTRFGARILELIPGDVSTEVDARLSFDVEGQIKTAQQIIAMYDEIGVDKSRVLIKLATTWEGVQACRELQKQGIKTNMTLLFGMAQAAAAADAGAYLISPFVGRILDWYKKHEGRDSYPAPEDPGVLSVRNIYNYYKCVGHDTIVMGASFRNKDEILQLAGCDRLTISPKFIAQLKETYEPVPHLLSRPAAEACNYVPISHDEKSFRWALNEDAMATEKLAEGIRGFSKDLVKLDAKLSKLMI